MEPETIPHTTPGATVQRHPEGIIRLEIPSGSAGRYRLAQLDDTQGKPRRDYRWRPPLTMSLEARTGADHLPGTWGFGFWNTPLSFSLGFGSSALLPELPNAVWFFHASARNHLTFRDDLPGSGFLMQAFRSAPLPAWALAPGGMLLPFLAVRPFSTAIRRAVSQWLIAEDGSVLDGLSAADWHRYAIRWTESGAVFEVDGSTVFESAISPRPPLGLVIWADNQFAAWSPDGRLGYGLQENPEPAWLEIRAVDIRPD